MNVRNTLESSVSFLIKTKIFKDKARVIQLVGASLVGLLILGVFLYCYFTYGKELTEIVSDPERFKALVESFNNWDRVAFVAIRAFQTVIKIIPAEPLEIGAGCLYGTWGGLLYCMLGTFLGSLVIIALSKLLGKRFVNVFFPVEKINSIKFLQDEKKVYFSLFFIYLIPGTPKDILTYAASITNINMVKFMIITSIARIPSIIISTIVGAEIMEKNYWLAAGIFIGTGALSIICSLIYNKVSKAHDKKIAEKEETTEDKKDEKITAEKS